MLSNRKISWTEHSKLKMRQYGLSKSKLLGLLMKPQRRELGIVPGTTALMQANKSYSKAKKKNNPGEIWIMYQDIKNKNIRKVISAWRYPGISKPGQEIPIPEDVRQELLENYGK